jgi:hypothetical protein
MNDLFLQHHILLIELEKSSRKIKYFEFHIHRCVKFEDKIRLTMLIASQIAYKTNVLIQLKSIMNEFISKNIPKFKEYNGIRYITCNQ